MSEGNICKNCRHWQADHDLSGCAHLWRGKPCGCMKFELYEDERASQLIKSLFGCILLIFIFAFSVSAQDVSLPRDVAEKALEALELRPAFETRIATLEKVNKELEAAKMTPCTIAAEKVKQDYVFWLKDFDAASPAKQKQIVKMLKMTRKQGRKMLGSQCGYKNDSILKQAWEAAKVGIPLAAILW